MRLLILLLLPIAAWGNACVAPSPGGNWATTGTWTSCGGVVPGNNDTISISDGATVTVSTSQIVGASAAPGTIAIQFNNTGALIIASGGYLRVRGDAQYNSGGGANTGSYLTVQAGGIWEWDASLASPTSTTYSAYPNGLGGFRPFVTTGTSGNHAIIRSNAGGGNGFFTRNGANTGGAYQFLWTDFLRIGDATHPAFDTKSAGTHANLTYWDSQYNTFTSCGFAPNSALASGEEIFRHNYNVHVNSVGTSSGTIAVMFGGGMSNPICPNTTTPCTAVGIRQMIGNVFDNLADIQFAPEDFVIHSNYFHSKLKILSSAKNLFTWGMFENNFYRSQDDTSEMFDPDGNTNSNLWFLDLPVTTNPHGPSPACGTSVSTACIPNQMTSEVIDHAGYITKSTSAWYIVDQTSGTYGLSYSLHVPNFQNIMSFWMISMLRASSSETYNLSAIHNTWVVTSASDAGVFAAHGGQASANPVGQLTNYVNNNLWNTGTPGQGWKLNTTLTWNTDVCHPANCDYNNGYQLNNGAKAGATNSGNGYGDNFTSIPGQHDKAVNPMFVDPTRNVATFDSAYLHNTPTAWSQGSSYSVGNMVSSQESFVYNNAIINYRYTNGPGCSVTTNPKPGRAGGQANVTNGSPAVAWVSGPPFDTNWVAGSTMMLDEVAYTILTINSSTSITLSTNVSGAGGNPVNWIFQPAVSCWEYATLYDIRQAQGATGGACPGTGIRGPQLQCLYDDQVAGSHGNDIIFLLAQWLRDGFSPQNQALALAGNDGRDIGAIPVTFNPPTFPSSSSGSTTVRGAPIRGAIVR
jgi:hypothetical protein